MTITGGTFAGDGDVLAANTAGTSITASYNSTTETLTLTGSDTLAHYQPVLDSVTFSSTSDNPTNFGSDTDPHRHLGGQRRQRLEQPEHGADHDGQHHGGQRRADAERRRRRPRPSPRPARR